MSIWDLVGGDDHREGMYDAAWQRRQRDRSAHDRVDQGVGDYERSSLLDAMTADEDAEYANDLARRIDRAEDEARLRAAERAATDSPRCGGAWPTLEQPDEERRHITPRFTIDGRTVTPGDAGQRWDTYPPQQD